MNPSPENGICFESTSVVIDSAAEPSVAWNKEANSGDRTSTIRHLSLRVRRRLLFGIEPRGHGFSKSRAPAFVLLF